MRTNDDIKRLLHLKINNLKLLILICYIKMIEKFICDDCNYVCYDKSNYNRHLKTIKHLNNVNEDVCIKKYNCNCGKFFSSRQGLSRHKKTCQDNVNNSIIIPENSNTNELIKELVNIIKDQQGQFCSVLSSAFKDQSSNLNTAITQINSSSGNNNNKLKNCENVKVQSDNKYITFQFYLDNKCTNAPTLPDFLTEHVRPLINKEPYSVSQIAKVCAEKLKETEDINRPLQALDGTLFMKFKDLKDEEPNWNETNKQIIDDKFARLSNDIVTEEHKEFENKYPDWDKNDELKDKYLKFVKYYPGHNDPKSFSSDREFQNIVKNSEVNKKHHSIK